MSDFISNYLKNFKEMMGSAISDDTPYCKTIEYLTKEFNDDNLTPGQKANLKAQVMSNITTSITNNAMQLALTLTNKELRIKSEIAILQNQEYVSNKSKDLKIQQLQEQIDALKENSNFTKEKTTQLIKAAKHNNKINAQQVLSEFFSQFKIGGGTLSKDMFKLMYTMIVQTYNDNADYQYPVGNIPQSEDK